MKYTKKQVTIEAVKWEGAYDPDQEWPVWFREAMHSEVMIPRPDGKLLIFTTEGAMHGDVGDMIIRGVKGEIYACKPDIFAMSYDAAGDAAGNAGGVT